MNSGGFEHPSNFNWVDVLERSGKELSITSLECIHATNKLPNVKRSSPNIFFYKRNIVNSEDIEEDMR